MSADSIALCKQLLTDNGYSVTNTRLAVFQLLVSQEPQTMARILERADDQLDRVSVYRSIDTFEKAGIVHRIYTGWKYKLELSDQFLAHHHHLSCLGCGLSIDIADEQHIDDFISSVAKKFDFQPKRHQFEIEGYCADCSK